MIIEEMKAKGFKRYTGVIEKLIVTNEVEVWAKDWDDANEILENAAEELPDSAFEDWERPEVDIQAIMPVVMLTGKNSEFEKEGKE